MFLLTEIDLLPLTILHVSTDYEMFLFIQLVGPVILDDLQEFGMNQELVKLF